MTLTIERFDTDETGIIDGPIIQVTNVEVTLTFPETEYESYTGFELLQMIRSERESLATVFAKGNDNG